MIANLSNNSQTFKSPRPQIPTGRNTDFTKAYRPDNDPFIQQLSKARVKKALFQSTFNEMKSKIINFGDLKQDQPHLEQAATVLYIVRKLNNSQLSYEFMRAYFSEMPLSFAQLCFKEDMLTEADRFKQIILQCLE